MDAAAEAEDKDALHELPSASTNGHHDTSPGLSRRLSALTISPRSGGQDGLPPKTPPPPKSPSAGLTRKTSSPALRRKSSTPRLAPPSPSSASVQPEERPPVTASTVATDYFRRELLLHHAPEDAQATPTHDADTLVITSDACYGHRFSRPKTSKTTLSFIVERPERLQAGALGLAAAYVRLGQRHAGGAAPPHPRVEPRGALPFRIQNTSRKMPLTSPAVAAVHGARWMQELTTMCDAAGPKLAAGEKELVRPDTPTTSGPPKPHLHEGDLYLCKESRDAFESALGGVGEAVDAVFQESGYNQPHRKAFVCIRPPGHHCSSDLPSGFCWINNVHVGIEYAAQTYGLTHAAIIDFDLHHGDGSQAIAWERNAKALKPQKVSAKNPNAGRKPFIGYFSLHDINSYPCEDGDSDKVQRASVCIDNAHGQTVWNVHLEPYGNEAEFWELYESRYMVLLEKARKFLRAHTERLRTFPGAASPKAAIFISAGFDASQWEMPTMQRHQVSVPTEFYARFTADIAKLAEEEGCGTDGRVISVLEGGYSDRALCSGVLSHVSGLASPKNVGMPPPPHFDASMTPPRTEQTPKWNPAWWSESMLTELENVGKPQPPPAPKRPPRSSEPHSYQSPTHSFAAKAVDPAKVYRTFSASHKASTPPRSRPPTPPPPDVEWAVAAHELSRLLIPSDRQINSCQHEELNVPKVKRERHSSIGIASREEQPFVAERVTRGRKAKATLSDAGSEEPDRRQTITPLLDTTTTAAGNESRAPSKARQASVARSEGIKVNKTRRASGSRDQLSKQTSMPPPPVPPVPRQRPSSRLSTTQSTTSSEPSQSTQSVDMDSLSAGVKKITLKLSREDEQAVAEAAAKKAAKKPAAPKASSKTTNAKAPATKKNDAAASKTAAVTERPVDSPAAPAGAETLPVSNEVKQVTASNETAVGAPADVTNANAAADHVAQPVTVDAAPSVNGQPNAAGSEDESVAQAGVESTAKTAEEPHTTSGAPSTEFVAYEPPGNAMQSNSEPQALTWMPTNTNTPMHLAGRKHIPVFTSRGHIPFAGGSAASTAASNGPPRAGGSFPPSSIPVPKTTTTSTTDADSQRAPS